MTHDVLQEQVAYYKARAAEYDEWFYRQGRYDRGPEMNERWFRESEEVFGAFGELAPSGEALEPAPGTGIWTERLCQVADHVTAVDASEEMMALNRAKLGAASQKVTYVIADLFAWEPERRYDAVVFGFWISHIPEERLDGFLEMIARALRPGGKLFFVDGQREARSQAVDHSLPEGGSEIMTRKLNDGRAFQIVKNFYAPEDLAARFARAGLSVDIRETANYFIYGFGVRG